jgi:hypothetical protein
VILLYIFFTGKIYLFLRKIIKGLFFTASGSALCPTKTRKTKITMVEVTPQTCIALLYDNLEDLQGSYQTLLINNLVFCFTPNSNIAYKKEFPCHGKNHC